MKYTIEGFSQEVAIYMRLDGNDLIFLRWLVDFYNTSKMKFLETEGQRFFWVHYKAVIESLPVLGVTTKKAIAQRMKRLCSKGILDFYCDERQKTYYKFKKEILERLVERGGGLPFERQGGCRLNGKGVAVQTATQYDSSINDSSINDISAPTLENKEELIKQDIITFWEFFLLKTKKRYKLTPERRKLIFTKLKLYKLSELKLAVENFIHDDWPGRKEHLDLIYCIGKQKGKPDNLEKWLNMAPKKKEVRYE